MASPHPIERARLHLTQQIEGLLMRHAIVALIGARQVGKTTLAGQIRARWSGPTTHFDLEDPLDAARLQDPLLALRELRGLVIIDEVQHAPALFPVLRVLADRRDVDTRFLLLGSASPELLQRSAETLAGRIVYQEVTPFRLGELLAAVEEPKALEPGSAAPWIDARWLRGGFPRALLAATDSASAEWREAFVQTFLERDLAQLGLSIPPVAARRLWTMLAHHHGGVLNVAALSRSLGVSDPTARRWVDALSGAMVVRQLQPWHANTAKRQVKRPKVYVADSGLLHTLHRIPDREALLSHPVCGASWEGFVIEEIVAALGASRRDCFFWATHAGAELDLLVLHQGKRLGFEIKRSATPRRTKSMAVALSDLALDRLDVVFDGDAVFPMAEGLRAVGVRRLIETLAP